MTDTPFDPAGTVDRRRVGLFVLVAYGLAWATALFLYATGGLANSREIAPGVTLSAVLLPTLYMFAPLVANLVARALTDEGFDDLLVRPRVRRHLRWYATAWLAPAALTLVGAALYFLAFPGHFDATMAATSAAVAAQTGQAVDPQLLAAGQLVAALTIGPVINALFAVGEELGWRAYLLPRLYGLGARRAVVAVGLVWGVWHWPVILMGYEYGFGYPGAPWTGLLAFLAFTVSAGTFLAWVTVRTDSVWPAAVGHGAINAVAGIGLLFVRGSPNPLLGPAPVGLVAVVPWVVVALALLWRRRPLLADPAPAESPADRSTGAAVEDR
ncbi:MAG: lysostaphin resistance A-like protein [Haloarculaceae archaeon]